MHMIGDLNLKDTRSIIFPVIILVFIGILMVYSSTALMSMRKYGSGFHYLWNHLITVFVGTAAMLVLSRINFLKIRPFVYVLLGVSLVMLTMDEKENLYIAQEEKEYILKS